MNKHAARQARIQLHAPDHDGAVSRILDAYDTGDQADGAWYDDAHQFAQDLADEYGTDFRTVAGVLAATSPNTGWLQNKQRTAHLVSCHKGGSPLSGHFKFVLLKSGLILQGYEPLDILRGPKERAFFQNIAEPDRPGPVTIDRHALNISHPTLNYKQLARPGVYEQVAATYRTAARQRDVLPHQVQAVTWCNHRGTAE